MKYSLVLAPSDPSGIRPQGGDSLQEANPCRAGLDCRDGASVAGTRVWKIGLSQPLFGLSSATASSKGGRRFRLQGRCSGDTRATRFFASRLRSGFGSLGRANFVGTARPRPGHGCEFDTCRLQMIGGFNAFEMLPPDNDGDWQPGPEEKWLVDAKIEADNDNKAAEKRVRPLVNV